MASKDISTILMDYNYNPSTNEIFVFGDIDRQQSLNFIKALNILESTPYPIYVHMSTDGGCVYAGFAMYDAILNSKTQIQIICHGLVASMGTIILQAADVKVATKNSTLMIHEMHSESSGNVKQISSMHQEDHRLHEKMIDIYSSASAKRGSLRKYTKEQRRQVFQHIFDSQVDAYLDPQEAKKIGLIDAII